MNNLKQEVIETILFFVDLDLANCKTLTEETCEVIKVMDAKIEVATHIISKGYNQPKTIELLRLIGADISADILIHTTPE